MEVVGWVLDYSMGIALVRDVVQALARRWPTAVIDNDHELPMTAAEYLERLARDPVWDWRRWPAEGQR